jgi:hypothetical protein
MNNLKDEIRLRHMLDAAREAQAQTRKPELQLRDYPEGSEQILAQMQTVDHVTIRSL